MGEKQRARVGGECRLDAREENAMKEIIPGVVIGAGQAPLRELPAQRCFIEAIEDGEAGMAAKRLVDADASERRREIHGATLVNQGGGVSRGARRGAQELGAVVEQSFPRRVAPVPFEETKFGSMQRTHVAVAKDGGDLKDAGQALGEQALHGQLGGSLQKTSLTPAAGVELHARGLEVRLRRRRHERDRGVHLEEAALAEEAAEGGDDGGAALHTSAPKGEIGAHAASFLASAARWCQPVLAVLVTLSPAVATAALEWPLARGAANLGRGGANVADPQDPTAIYLNPAALAGLKGLQLMVDSDSILDYRAFARAPDDLDADGDDTQYDEAANAWLPSLSPGVFAAYNFAGAGLGQLTVAAALYGPMRAWREWPADGAQRYSEVDFRTLQVHYALGAGYELPWYRLRVGATLLLTSQQVDTTVALNTFVSFPENADFDAVVHVKTRDDFIPTAVFGVSGAPVPWLITSLSLQLPYDVRATGTADITLGDELARSATLTGDKLDLSFDLPAVLRAGLLYRHPGERFEVELALVWEGWSRYDEAGFVPKNITIGVAGNDIDMEPMRVQLKARDIYSLRLGGQVVAVPEVLLVRAGAFYERAAARPNYISPAVFDLDKVGAAVGGRLDFDWSELPVLRGAWLDFTVAYVHWLTRTVEDSEVRLTNPLTSPPQAEWPIGNGTYQNRQIIVQVGLGTELDI